VLKDVSNSPKTALITLLPVISTDGARDAPPRVKPAGRESTTADARKLSSGQRGNTHWRARDPGTKLCRHTGATARCGLGGLHEIEAGCSAARARLQVEPLIICWFQPATGPDAATGRADAEPTASGSGLVARAVGKTAEITANVGSRSGSRSGWPRANRWPPCRPGSSENSSPQLRLQRGPPWSKQPQRSLYCTEPEMPPRRRRRRSHAAG